MGRFSPDCSNTTFFSDFAVVEIEYNMRCRVVSGDVQVAQDFPASLLVYHAYAFNLFLCEVDSQNTVLTRSFNMRTKNSL